MAGAGIVTDGEEGFIIEPHDKEGWINAMQKLFSSASLRNPQSTAARKIPDVFLWENIDRKRTNLLLNKL